MECINGARNVCGQPFHRTSETCQAGVHVCGRFPGANNSNQFNSLEICILNIRLLSGIFDICYYWSNHKTSKLKFIMNVMFLIDFFKNLSVCVHPRLPRPGKPPLTERACVDMDSLLQYLDWLGAPIFSSFMTDMIRLIRFKPLAFFFAGLQA